MKKSEALGTVTRARIFLDELTKFEVEKGELCATTRTFDLRRLNDIHEFLSKITEKEFGEISGRKAEVRFKAPQLF